MNDKTNPFSEGHVFLLDKPLEWTSFDAVRKIRNACKIKKVGHAGTLDPLATGLLIICTGKFTKRIEEFQAKEKEYTGTLVLGATTPSFDLETAVDQTFDISGISDEMIAAVAASFVGDIEQTPPVFSAIKINGKRAFDMARMGDIPEIKSRKVTVSTFEIGAVDLPVVHFRIVCSKGTYIRSLVSDLGKKLNNGAYMSSLRRTRIGEFRIEDAKSIPQTLEEIAQLLEGLA